MFSYNTTLGPSDQAHGYQPAKEAVDGKLVDGIGGGICQTSSTLYNAVDQLRVTYVETIIILSMWVMFLQEGMQLYRMAVLILDSRIQQEYHC